MNGPTFAAPTAARPAAPPRPAAPRPAAKPDADAAVAGFRLLAWLRLYWLTILFCGSLLGTALAYAAWSLLPSKYESYALLRVASAPFSVANQKDPTRSQTAFTTYLKTNARLIRSEFVLSKALTLTTPDGRRISELPTIKAQPNPIQFLEEEIQVPTPADGLETITLSMRGHNPDDVKAIVNAVTEAFMAEVIEKEIKERSDFLIKVEETLAKLQSQLNEAVRKPVGDAGILQAGGLPPAPLPPLAAAVPPPPPGQEPPAWLRKKAAETIYARATHYQEQVESLPLTIESQRKLVESLKQQIDALLQGPPSPETLAEVEKDEEVQKVAQRERAYRARYTKDRNTYANPDAEVLQAYLVQADAAAAELKQLKDKKAKEREHAKRQPKADVLFPQYDAAVRKLRDLEEQLRVARERLKVATEALAQIPGDPAAPGEKMADDKEKKPLVNPDDTYLLAQDSIFNGLAQHAASLRLDIHSPKRVSIWQPASTPTAKDARKQILATAFAGLMGFALVGLGVVAYEARAKKVCGLADLATTTPVPVVGVIPWTPDGAANRDPLRRAEVTEAVDKLRAYVAQTWLARGATTVAVSSPLGDEGKAFAAFGLAASLAQGGYKTLLVDFDLRQPALHPLAGVPNAAGVCELLRGEADFRQTIQVLPNGLHFLPAGRWSDEARPAAVGGRLESLLSRLKEPFDCVVLHAHALLTAAESVEVARRCEVILLCTLYRDTRLPLVKKAAERVATMEVPYSGVVYLGATPQEALC